MAYFITGCLKSGTKVERHQRRWHEDAVRFLSVLAVELLQLTYLHRTQPEASVEMVLNSTHCSSRPSLLIHLVLTVAWAVEATAQLGGYLEHRKTSIGIQVLWRGWLNCTTLRRQLARETWSWLFSPMSTREG